MTPPLAQCLLGLLSVGRLGGPGCGRLVSAAAAGVGRAVRSLHLLLEPVGLFLEHVGERVWWRTRLARPPHPAPRPTSPESVKKTLGFHHFCCTPMHLLRCLQVPWIDSISLGREIYRRFRNLLFLYVVPGERSACTVNGNTHVHACMLYNYRFLFHPGLVPATAAPSGRN